MQKLKKWSWSLLILALAGCGITHPTQAPSSTTDESAASTSTSSEDPATDLPEESDVLSFVAVGDNLIHSQIYDESKLPDGTYDFSPRYALLAPDIEAADLAYVNQESILGGDDLGFSTYPAFNTPSDMAGQLADMGFNLVSIANNHTLDKGIQGVRNTLSIWEEHSNDVLVTGAFDSQEARDAIPTVEMGGITFSFLAYTYGTNGIQADVPYRLNYFSEERVTQDVQRAKEQSDFVIVSAHWGDEYAQEPNDFQKSYAQLLADLGVDVVIGAHSHTIQPIEWVQGKDGSETLVLYSLGNFLASTPNDVALLGGMVNFDIQKSDLTIENVRFEPLVIHYEASVPSDIYTRESFYVTKLKDYTEEEARAHGLNGYENHTVSIDRFHQWVDTIIDPAFRQ